MSLELPIILCQSHLTPKILVIYALALLHFVGMAHLMYLMYLAKSCELDSFPSRLLVRHCLEVPPIITQIVNASLTHGEFSSQLKTALVHPLLKKPGTDCIFRNYRPISNLPFLSKFIERIVCNQITHYTGTTGMAEKFQSAYRAFHST